MTETIPVAKREFPLSLGSYREKSQTPYTQAHHPACEEQWILYPLYPNIILSSIHPSAHLSYERIMSKRSRIHNVVW